MISPSPNIALGSDGPGVVAGLMPNRAYSKIWRGVAVAMFLMAVVICLDPLGSLLSEFRARLGWSRTEGQVASAQVLSAPENRSPGGSPSISATRTMYWAAFHLDFRPSGGCRTGIVVLDRGTSPGCSAYIQTIPHDSSTNAYAWLARHPSGSSTRILYDPSGPGVKFADESLLELVRWNRLAMAALFIVIGTALLSAVRRRLAELADLPESEAVPAVPLSSKPDDLIDMKLS
jgi:hypothetical protein